MGGGRLKPSRGWVSAPKGGELIAFVASSVVDPNILNLDPDPGFWPDVDPDPGPDLDPGLYNQF